jgi:hypothetical protein
MEVVMYRWILVLLIATAVVATTFVASPVQQANADTVCINRYITVWKIVGIRQFNTKSSALIDYRRQGQIEYGNARLRGTFYQHWTNIRWADSRFNVFHGWVPDGSVKVLSTRCFKFPPPSVPA